MKQAALVAVLLVAHAALADARGEAVLARARATERAQLAALAGTTLEMHTTGTLRNGKKTQTIEALRHLGIATDGSIHNDFVWGKIDGQPLEPFILYVLRPGHAARLSSTGDARAMLMGGGAFTTPKSCAWCCFR